MASGIVLLVFSDEQIGQIRLLVTEARRNPP